MKGRDPFPYEGEITRADGVRPFNHYLWPLSGDQWWAYHDTSIGFRATGRFHIEVIALADGRWSSSGSVADIERGSDMRGAPVVFDARDKAIRSAVARFIRLCRWARRWERTPDYLTEQMASKLINWALSIAGAPPAALRPIARPRVKTGMALFDWEVAS